MCVKSVLNPDDKLLESTSSGHGSSRTLLTDGVLHIQRQQQWGRLFCVKEAIRGGKQPLTRLAI